MLKTNYNKRVAISNCYRKGIIIRQSAYDLLLLIGYSPREAETVLWFIDAVYKRDKGV